MTSKPHKRYRVSDLGFGFAVHDTASRQQYEFEAGREKQHASKNVLNSERLEIFPTRKQAQDLADRLNEAWERESPRRGA